MSHATAPGSSQAYTFLSDAEGNAKVPSDPPPPPPRLETPRLRPPRRGDRIASPLLMAAVVLFVGGVFVLLRLGIISFELDGADPHRMLLLAINVLSLALTILGFGWSWVKDWRWLRSEEHDVEFMLHGPGKEDPRRVLFDDHAGGQPFVRTLIDDRVIRLLGVNDIAPSIQLVHESELRAVAVWRSANVGTFARYISGLLLLLTVLGTFVGVKSALEPLTTALQQGLADNVDPAALAGPLQNVAAAFGSNLTALVGAIALGLGAFALSLGRQSFLARLEQASSLYIYPHVEDKSPAARLAVAADRIGEVAATTERLTQASVEMSRAASKVGDASQNVGSLSDAIQDLSDTVGTSLGQTREAIQALLAKQASQVADQSRQVVDRIERQLSDTATSVQHATAIYGTLVERLSAQQQTMDDATIAMNSAAKELLETRISFGRYVDDAKRVIDDRLESIARSTAGLNDVLSQQLLATRRTQKRYRHMDQSLGQLVNHAESLGMALQEDERRRRESAKGLGDKIAEAVFVRLQEPLDALTESTKGIVAGTAGIENVLSGVPQKVQDGVSVALRSTQVTIEMPPVPGELEAAISQLAKSVWHLELELSRPMWRRIFRRRAG